MESGRLRAPEEVLVLNYNYQPLNITSVRRAILLICGGKAHTLETDSRVFHSELLTIKAPTVVRLNYYVRRPLPVLRANRKSIFARDRYACQYCGGKGVTLTLDHILPREKGGVSDWENLVCCCTKCNNIKANRTPEEAGLKMMHQPRRPKYIPYINYTRFLSAIQDYGWQPYLAPYGDEFAVPAERTEEECMPLEFPSQKSRHARSVRK